MEDLDDITKAISFKRFYNLDEKVTYFQSSFYSYNDMPFDLALKWAEANAHVHSEHSGEVSVTDCLPDVHLSKKKVVY